LPRIALTRKLAGLLIDAVSGKSKLRLRPVTAMMAPLLAGASPAGAQPLSKTACALPQGWSAVAARKTRYILFGEVHGSREAPAFVGTTVCALAARGKRLLVAVEHHSADDPALQAAWALPHAQFPAALRLRGWAGRYDGVASEAMFALLVRLHELKSRGRRIDVVAFNGARDEAQRARFSDLPGQGPHEAAQAENIRRAAEAKRYDHVLVLVGNLHARKQPVERRGAAYEPMAMRLAPAAAITSLNMAHAGGTLWNCLLRPGTVIEPGKPLPPSAIACASHVARSPVNLHRVPFIGIGTPPHGDSTGAYDGFFWLGEVSGSPPAVPAADAPAAAPLPPPKSPG
jgi:hypothetical protein